VKLLDEFPGTSAWISFSAKDEKHICHGEIFSECVAWLNGHPQVVALGINCTSPKFITPLVRAARKVTEKPILVYPNSGEIYDAATNSWHGETSHELFGSQSKEWYKSGASLIGGCCRTTPDHIREIASWVRT
jgi:homocysteine S-methyltransferase